MNEILEPQPRQVSYTLPVHKPVATWVLLGIIVAVFGIETLAGGSTDTDVLIRLGAKFTPLIAVGEYWRLFTSMFLHIGLWHLLFNGYALVILGTELERLLGWGRFLAIYILSGLFGSLVSYAFSPYLSAGASGAIFGLIGALAAFFGLHRRALGTWGRSRLANIVFLIVINLLWGFTQTYIDNWAHLGGLVCGLALGWALAPRYRVAPDGLHLEDRNRLSRYWPALALAVAILVGGTYGATLRQNNNPQISLGRAQQALEQERWGEAVTEIERALAQDPTVADAPLYFALGVAHNYLEQPRLAAEAYHAALDQDPEHSDSRWNLALTYLELDQYPEALTQFETYLRLNPDEAEAVQPYLDELGRIVR